MLYIKFIVIVKFALAAVHYINNWVDSV